MDEKDWIILRMLWTHKPAKLGAGSWEFKQWCKTLVYLTKKYGNVNPYINQLAVERKQHGTR